MPPQRKSKPKGAKAKGSVHNYSCALCPYSSKTLQHYQQHGKVHSNERPFKCPECPYRAKRKQSVKSHIKTVHLFKSPSSRRFPCPESGCNYAAKNIIGLNAHWKTHFNEKSLFCSHPNCNYSTNKKTHLNVHIRIHTGEKPFVCQFESCSYATAYQSALVNHSRTHTKEKPYKCPKPNCAYSTTQSGNLKEHQLTHEPVEGEERQSFKCPLCDYSGKIKNDLSNHVKTHTLEKLCKCDEPNCNYEAKTKTEIKHHKLVHSDEKPFGCSFESCELRFKTKANLKNHLKTHSDERRYKCELCPFRGKILTYVTKHIKEVHSEPNFRPFKCTAPNCSYAAKRRWHLTQHLLTHQPNPKEKVFLQKVLTISA